MPDPNQLLGQGPPAKKQKLTETKLIGHIDDDTSLHELESLDLEEPDWRASSSSTQRPGPKLISEAPELKEARRKTQTEGSEATTVAPSHRGPIQPKKGVTQWETVKCDKCGKVVGQYKKDPSLVPETKQLAITGSMPTRLEVPWFHKQVVFEVLTCLSFSLIVL